jgi:hypothetical protein
MPQSATAALAHQADARPQLPTLDLRHFSQGPAAREAFLADLRAAAQR